MAATTITLTIPEAVLTRLVNALCVPQGLPATGPNARKALRELLEQRVQNYEHQTKEREAAEAVPAPPEGITVA